MTKPASGSAGSHPAWRSLLRTCACCWRGRRAPSRITLGNSTRRCSASVPLSIPIRGHSLVSTWSSTPCGASCRTWSILTRYWEGDQSPLEAFMDRLEAKLDLATVLLREPGGVLLAPMHTLHGLRFDFVAIGGTRGGRVPSCTLPQYPPEQGSL